MVSSSKLTISDTSLEHTANQAIAFLGNFRFYFTLLVSLVSTPYMIILAIVDSICVEQFLVREQNLHCVLSFRKRLHTFLSFLFMFVGVSCGSTIFLCDRRSRSFFNVRRTLVQDTLLHKSLRPPSILS